MKTGLIITVSMLQPSPQSSSRYPSERRGLGEKKEKKEGKKKEKQQKSAKEKNGGNFG